jgi:ATP-dependent RNA helicase SUPV3L1/SUV3
MQRFVDRRTSALLKTLNSEEDAPAEVGADGRVLVGGHDIGRLDGLSFVPDATGQTLEGRALRNAALKGLRPVISQRLLAIANADDAALSLNHDEGALIHAGATVAKLKPGATWLSPGVELVGAPDASVAEREAAVARLAIWLADQSDRLLKPAHDLKAVLAGSSLPGPARGAAYQLSEAGAALDRRHTDALGPEDRAALQAVGVKSGRIAAWLPGMLKPAAARLTMTLRSVHAGVVAPLAPSSASFALAGQTWPDVMLQAAGYLRLGPRAVRADMAERLSWSLGQARRGSDTSAFVAPPELAAQIGCPIGEFQDVLRALGLKPAERNPETNAVTRWRFASQKTAQRRDDRKRETATATGPFAALAALVTPPPAAQRRRRRHRGKPSQPKTAIS